jgi:hypothetical protein
MVAGGVDGRWSMVHGSYRLETWTHVGLVEVCRSTPVSWQRLRPIRPRRVGCPLPFMLQVSAVTHEYIPKETVQNQGVGGLMMSCSQLLLPPSDCDVKSR